MALTREVLDFNPDEPMPVQSLDWTCSACALAWGLRALELWNDCGEADAVDAIGCPENINSTYGLMDGSGAELVAVFRRYAVPAFTCWPTWHQVLNLSASGLVLIGGASWYHWVGVRSSGSYVLYLANSAPGWMGIDDELQEVDWNELGPFAAVVVPSLQLFPPPAAPESVTDAGE